MRNIQNLVVQEKIDYSGQRFNYLTAIRPSGKKNSSRGELWVFRCDCGNPPNQVYDIKKNTNPYIYNGIDRLDNTFGYAIFNVVPCCGTCNKMKSTLDIKSFAKKIRDIYENRFGMIEDSEFA